jgi:hypothetical protein
MCSQEPSTGSYPQPDESSPYHSILCLSDPFNITLHLLLDLSSGLFTSGFPTKILYTLIFSP